MIMKCNISDKNEIIMASALAAILIFSISTVTSRETHNSLGIVSAASALQLQFPTSQKLDLMAVNSGSSPNTNNLQLPVGYKIEPVLWNLTTPGTVAFDDKGNVYLSEVGSSYGQLTSLPRIYKLQSNGNMSVLVDRFVFEPISDIEFNKNNGLLYVSHRGIISTVNLTSGLVKDLVVGLPSVDFGSHPQGQIAFGSDGRVYFTTGTSTNSGVVDKSDLAFGWLKLQPQMYDIPGQNITLTGQNFVSKNLLDPTDKSNKTTGAFVPFGTPTKNGQMIKGQKICNGCLFSIKPDGTDLRLHAWGLRSPFGMVFDEQDGRFFISNDGADDKGIRPITNDTDNIYSFNIKNSGTTNNITWYGWPDFYGNGEPVTDHKFGISKNLTQPLQFLIKNHPPLTKPFTTVGVGPGVTQAAFVDNKSFIGGEKPKIFLGEFGIAIPINHLLPPLDSSSKVRAGLPGQKVIAIDPQIGNSTDFISLKKPNLNFRPVGVKFNEKEGALYIIDFGKAEIRSILPNGTPLPMPVVWPYANSGVVWKVTKTGTTTPAPPTTAATASSITNATTTQSPTGIPGVP
jgi:glucose/arabinose dehydrogenase